MNRAALEDRCRQLPGATEEILWDNNRVFKVGGKMFYASNASDAPDGRCSFKVDDDRFLELTDQPGIHPAPYLARARWVQIDPLSCTLDQEALIELVERSHTLVFSKLTKKLQRSILDQ